MAYIDVVTKDTSKEEAEQQMAEFLGPGHVDQTIRQAIYFCWLSLPADRKNAEEVERQVRRIVDRALKDYHEDASVFHKTISGQGSRPRTKGKKKPSA
jgi:hypothetical protein